MRIASCRCSSVRLLILLVVSSLSHVSSARKLRGTRARGRGLNQDGLLFTEGRKGGDRNEYDHQESEEDYWDDAQDSREGPAGPASPDNAGGTNKQKGESFYDRPAMKFNKESKTKTVGNKATSREEPSMKSTEEPSIKYKSATTAPDDSMDSDVPRERPSEDYEDTPAPVPKGGNKGSKPDYEEEEEDEEPEDYNPPPEPGKYAKDTDEEDGYEEAYDETDVPTQVPVEPDAREGYSAKAAGNAAGNDLNQVEFVLSQFGLEFELAGLTTTSTPQTMDFAEVEAATKGFLEEFLELTYSADPMIFFHSVEIEATSRRTGGTSMTPFIDFEASVAFVNNSPMTPTNDEIGLTISAALAEPNLTAYLLSLQGRLSVSNPFLSTSGVTVYVPDARQPQRISDRQGKLSAAGIAAAASTGLLTLVVGGFLLFKIKKENEDIVRGGKYGKGYVGGATLAGDTYDNETLEDPPSATMPTDDGQSFDTSMYHDDRSILSSVPPEVLEGTENADEESENVDEEKSDTDSVPFDCSSPKLVNDNVNKNEAMVDDGEEKKEDKDEEYEETVEEFNDEAFDEEDPKDSSSRARTVGAAYASLVGRTKAFVPSFKQPSPLSNNVDIKNYFKSKYNCKSPQGYEAVDDSTSGGAISDDGVTLSEDVRIHDSRDLVIPALDHDTGAASEKASAGIPGSRIEGDPAIQQSQPSQVFRTVDKNATHLEAPGSRELPTEVQGYSDRARDQKGGTGTGSVGKSFDDVSLDTMTTLTEI